MQHRGAQGPNDSRNVILAIVLSGLIMLAWTFFYDMPRQREAAAERARVEAQQSAQAPAAPQAQGAEPAPGESQPGQPAAEPARRISVNTTTVAGSISLEGARIDQLSLHGYCRSIERTDDGRCLGVNGGSGEVTLLAPITGQYGHDAFFGWERRDGENAATLADAFSTWQASEGAALTEDAPVTLTLTTADGLVIERTIALDADYMFTITDVVRNPTDAAVGVRPFGAVRRQGLPQDYRNQPIVHQGMVGAFGPNNRLHQIAFKRAQEHARDKERGRAGEDERLVEEAGQGGWFGITDHYWLTAIVPDQNERVSAFYDSRPQAGSTDFRAAYRGEWRDVPAGGEITYTQRLFAGAKRVDLLQAYQENLAIPRFDDAVDWGNFWFLTRPFFLWLLHPLAKLLGNFGLGILATTVVVKLILFPLVYHSFKSMAKLRGLQPKMKEIQERFAADKQRQQQEMIRLYQTEKINPVSGCLPILLQIPVFYALYKTLTVTIEMRHAPFYGWIRDLSAPDPTSIFNLFGLLPFDVPGFLMIGAWPILYGISMWLLQALSPPPTDPVQAQIFRLLPLLFTFMFAGFPAGLVIYWTWSNVLSILQQYVIMRRQGVETQLDQFIAKRLRKADATAAQ
ncbi:MAG: membrane protein insertase YidC [Hyphomonadaceae bacterium]